MMYRNEKTGMTPYEMMLSESPGADADLCETRT